MGLMIPELIIIVFALSIIIAEAIGVSRKILYGLAILAVLAATFQLILGTPLNGEAFEGRFLLDPVAWWFKLGFLASSLFLYLIAYDATENSEGLLSKIPSGGEFIALTLLTLVGAMFLVSSQDIIMAYISLELTTIPLALLVAWQKVKEHSTEAGIKYILLGGFSSSFLLFGLGLLYGISGSTSIPAIAQSIQLESPVIWFVFAMVIISIGFKMTMVPFHLWASDVYRGAPLSITAFLSTFSKGVGLALGFHLIYRIFGSFIADWSMFFAIMAALTMTLGNTVALSQEHIKRFMAFSSISQAGYFLMGFVGGDSLGVSAIIFYFIVYVFCNFTVFAVMSAHYRHTGKQSITSYSGLSITNPVLALVMLLALLSLAGVPPLSGFVGKFFLFNVAAKSGFDWLVGVAALNSTVSLYYYLKIARMMYIEKPQEGATPVSLSLPIRTALVLGTIGVVTFGLVPHLYEGINQNTTTWLVNLIEQGATYLGSARP